MLLCSRNGCRGGSGCSPRRMVPGRLPAPVCAGAGAGRGAGPVVDHHAAQHHWVGGMVGLGARKAVKREGALQGVAEEAWRQLAGAGQVGDGSCRARPLWRLVGRWAWTRHSVKG